MDVFDDIMQGLNEIGAYQKGNITLKSHVVSIPDDDISIRFNQLQEEDKRIISVMIDKLLVSSRKAI